MRPSSLVFQATTAGLANRLRALVGYQVLSEFLELPFYLLWERNTDCDAEFHDLFETRIPTIDGVEAADPGILVFNTPAWFSEIWRAHLEDRVPRDDFLKRVRTHLDRLTPVRSLQQKVDAFAEAHDIFAARGVHIRHTDNVAAYREFAQSASHFDLGRVSLLPGFLQEMDALAEAGNIFLATDNPKVEQLCVHRYGGRMIRYEKQYSDSTLRTSSVEDALVEFLLLGRCSDILGTYYSSYSQLSAIWSGRPYREMIGTTAQPSRFVDKMNAAMRRA